MSTTIDINNNYTKYYNKSSYLRVYPTEFVLRAFLQTKLPGLHFERPKQGETVLEIGFGDGRNTVLLLEQGYHVTGVEITKDICEQTAERLKALGHNNFDFNVGRNNNLPFKDNTFGCLLASHTAYYLDEGTTFDDNMEEYARVLKKGGYAVFDILRIAPEVQDDINILNNPVINSDGTVTITSDPLGIRNGYRFQVFKSTDEMIQRLSKWFYNFSVGTADNNFFGVTERTLWVVCQKK